jgi:hypothetical protein
MWEMPTRESSSAWRKSAGVAQSPTWSMGFKSEMLNFAVSRIVVSRKWSTACVTTQGVEKPPMRRVDARSTASWWMSL